MGVHAVCSMSCALSNGGHPAPLSKSLHPPACCRDCIGADETCAAIASRACRRSTCEGGTGVVTTTSCTGFCTSGGCTCSLA